MRESFAGRWTDACSEQVPQMAGHDLYQQGSQWLLRRKTETHKREPEILHQKSIPETLKGQESGQRANCDHRCEVLSQFGY